LATIVDTVPVPLATKVDRTPSVPLAMIVAVFTKVRGIACFQIVTPRNPALGARKSAAKELKLAVDRFKCASAYNFTLNKRFNFCCFRALAYITLNRLCRAVFEFFYIIFIMTNVDYLSSSLSDDSSESMNWKKCSSVPSCRTMTATGRPLCVPGVTSSLANCSLSS